MKKRRPYKLSAKQRELLARAVAGEDRQIPERFHHEPGRSPFVLPARRWFVPRGFLVTEGSAEAGAARALAVRGMLKHDSVAPSPENKYGLGGYSITAKGRRALVD
jgi:hypothetical protein